LDARQTELVKSLFKMAWADGHVTEQEVDVLSDILDRLGLPLAEKLAVMDFGLSEPRLGEDRIDDVLTDHDSRLQALEHLITVCFCDLNLDPAELRLIEELSLRWGITAGELERLRQKALQALAEGH
jgi:uncharacterized tellurite resistance protein B-like protein